MCFKRRQSALEELQAMSDDRAHARGIAEDGLE